jgi:hypothetical protein
MFNASSLLRFFKPSCSTGACDTATAGTVQELLIKENIGILSASCCDSSTQGRDELLASNLAQAMERAGLERQIIFSTVTATRQQLRDLGAHVDGDIQVFKENLVGLFQGQGLAAFPILVIGGKIAFYGGVPTIDQIQQKLQTSPALQSAGSP